jgi:glutathione S-transferase
MNIELISHPLCPYVQRSVVLLREKGVPFEFRDIDLKNKPEWFLALSPRGKVPVLVVQPAPSAAKTAIFESDVINEYLDETTTPRLMPEDPLRRARLRGFVEVANDLLAAMTKVVYGKTEEQWREGRDAAHKVLGRVEEELEGDFFGGDRFGLVDAAFAPALYRFALLGKKTGVVFVEGLPKVQEWAKRIVARASVQASVLPDFPARYEAALREREAWLVSRLS